MSFNIDKCKVTHTDHKNKETSSEMYGKNLVEVASTFGSDCENWIFCDQVTGCGKLDHDVTAVLYIFLMSQH